MCASMLAQQQQPDGRGAENPAIHPEGRTIDWWLERHAQKVSEAKAGGIDLLFVGDSITHNYERSGPAPDEVFLPIWNQFFAPHHALNLGFNGDLTQQVLWRLAHGEVDGLSPKNIVLLIGTNNTISGEGPLDSAAGVIAVVDDLHSRMPQAKVTLIEVLPSGISERKTVADRQVNAILSAHYKGSTYVHCLDLSRIFLKHGKLNLSLFYDPRLTPPGPPIHPNSVAQRRMAEAVAASLYR
ncbi:GDSL-type esterase/lipase family protein [Granulicella sp. WH15]|uniref:GDSL-type esterase/lipase family protein n=1 Tax=Granulicella sp. WH15 TaxID=2602070 RepID=UPI001C708642|nr:GDSL-type esterase/lipase family protein [Granulicella sp. WH15]